MPTYYDIKKRPIRTDHVIRPVRAIHGYGAVLKEYRSKPSRIQCKGCRDDYYNHGKNAMNPTEGCWSFKSATVVDKIGHTSIYVSGPDGKMVKTLSCWHSVQK